MITSTLKQLLDWLKEAVTWFESLTLGAKLTTSVLTMFGLVWYFTHLITDDLRLQLKDVKRDFKEYQLQDAARDVVRDAKYEQQIHDTQIKLDNCEIDKNDILKKKMADLEKQLEQLKTNNNLLGK